MRCTLGLPGSHRYDMPGLLGVVAMTRPGWASSVQMPIWPIASGFVIAAREIEATTPGSRSNPNTSW
jgi:hypothetical protein